MILIITSEKHRYTHDSVRAEGKVDVRILSYRELQEHATALPKGTYIFTDVDRLSPASAWEASKAYRALKRAGQRVLNDPARMLSRFGLLRALNRAGINEFDAYRVEDAGATAAVAGLPSRRWGARHARFGAARGSAGTRRRGSGEYRQGRTPVFPARSSNMPRSRSYRACFESCPCFASAIGSSAILAFTTINGS